jgi:hypothetical protein
VAGRLLILATVLCGAARLHAADGTPSARWPRLSSGALQDNSFLIEEAYNQEAGVVQHILDTRWDRGSRDWQIAYTQEWPVPDERHQLSFTVPYTWLGGGGGRGPGDVLLNYRYQLLREEGGRPAVAPRISLILPTGSVRDGLGDGSVGVQALVPASRQFGEHWAAHLNAGVTIIPHALAAGVPGAEQLVSWVGGGSLIWEPTDGVNVLGELLGGRDEEVAAQGVDHRDTLTFSPGVRMGWNIPAGVQLVAGVGVPIGLTRESDDLGVFLYLSVEHAVTAAARAARW